MNISNIVMRAVLPYLSGFYAQLGLGLIRS